MPTNSSIAKAAKVASQTIESPDISETTEASTSFQPTMRRFDALRYRVSRSRPKWLFQAHLLAYRLTGGLLTATSGRMPVLLLTTIGRKTGKQHTWPLSYFRQGNALILVASNCGCERPPAWYLNLQAMPTVTVQVGYRRQRMMARIAGPEERLPLWEQAQSLDPLYTAYERTANREIPIVLLQEA